MNRFNSRKPHYNDDSDYTTNTPSYYDDLARTRKLIEELAKRIWDYEKTLEENLQKLKDKLSEIEHLIGDGFNDVIEDLLREWVNDGTLEHIINEEIFNTKADKDYVDKELYKNYRRTLDYLKLSKDKNDGISDNYNDLVELINECKVKNKGLYIPNGKFYVSEDIMIDEIDNILIDGELIIEDGKMLEILGGRGQFSYNVEIRKVTGKVRLAGFFNSFIKILGATEIELYANGDKEYIYGAMAYNTLELGRVELLSILSEGYERGWVNENKFYGGRFFKILIDGNYNHNHNIFYSPSIENGEIIIKRGSFNYFKMLRLEGENNIEFGNEAFNNRIENSWSGNSKARGNVISPLYTNIIDDGESNIVYNVNNTYNNVTEIFRFDSFNHNLDEVEKVDNKVKLNNNYYKILKLEDIPIDKSLTLIAKSHSRNLRVRVTLKNNDKYVIRDDESITGTALAYLTVDYMTRFNYDEITTNLFPGGSAKFFDIEFMFGDETANSLIDYVKIFLVTPKNESVPLIENICNMKRGLFKNRKPNETNYVKNTLVKHGAILEGRDYAWVYDGNEWLTISQLL